MECRQRITYVRSEGKRKDWKRKWIIDLLYDILEIHYMIIRFVRMQDVLLDGLIIWYKIIKDSVLDMRNSKYNFHTNINTHSESQMGHLLSLSAINSNA